MKLGYRPEIDGMRAIAVSAVILYHLKIPFGDGSLLAGGYLGVDLFFVLSGYLITRSGRTLVFSALANDMPDGTDAQASAAVDRALVALADAM